MNKKFNLGDVVTWSSQSHGTHNTKHGTIIEVVAPHYYGKNAPKNSGRSRDHESYIVAVTHVNGKQIAGLSPRTGLPVNKRTPKTYWPVVSLLKRSNAPSAIATPPYEHKQTTCHQTAE